ncbi:MFS transporter [Amycolatopsis taiwanensis]|uniref:MFS transporter n=1 Tax=Amycolatopsis taiwanensis TaxID=342230 RepID=UPI00069373E7|nr:MFS transporter [Amycolatopsis taiwanensis]
MSSSRTSVLAMGAFAVGTSGYVVAGLLSALTAELSVSASAAAQLVTVFSLAYAIGSPVLSAASGRWERRRLLVAALAVTALGNALAALAPNYGLLLVARVVTAAGAAVFTPVASAVAAELAPPERRGRAVAVVFGGLTIALILGVPVGNLISLQVGYRGVFLLVALFALAAAVAVRMLLPTVSAPPAVPFMRRFDAARSPRVLVSLFVTVLAVLGTFAAYTFISPILAATAGLHGTIVSVLLFCYGIGGAIGNVVGGRAADRWGSRKPLMVVLAGAGLSLAVLPLVATSVPGAVVALFVWGLCGWAFNPPMQHGLIGLTPAAPALVLSLNASAIYLGAGLSGIAGGLVLTAGGPNLLPEFAAVLTVIALLAVFVGLRQRAGDVISQSDPGNTSASCPSVNLTR